MVEESSGGGTSTGGGAKPKQGGRQAMTRERRDMIKGGSIIAQARKGTCDVRITFRGSDPLERLSLCYWCW